MDVFETIDERYSVRGYKPDPVDDETLRAVLEAARQAPTAANRQPFRSSSSHAAGARRSSRAIYGRPLVHAGAARASPWSPCPARPGGAWTTSPTTRSTRPSPWTTSSSRRRASGLGTCWIAAFDPTAAREVLGLPDDVEPIAFTPLGYPDKDRPRPAARPLDELVRYERW